MENPTSHRHKHTKHSPNSSSIPPNIEKTKTTQLRSGISADRNGRTYMEDMYLLVNDFQTLLETEVNPSLFLGVYDGHAGSFAAEFVRNRLHLNISEIARSAHTLTTALEKAFVQTDEEFLETGLLDESGCTCTVTIITEAEIYTSNVGDSRSILSRRGKAVQLSQDHRPDSPHEVSRVEQSGGFIVGDRLNGWLSCTRAIGDYDMFSKQKCVGLCSTPYVSVIEITEDDEFIIVASDGLWDFVSSQQAVEVVREVLEKCGKVEKASDVLVKLAIKNGSDDNITVAIVTLKYWNVVEEEKSEERENVFVGTRPKFRCDGLNRLKKILEEC